ncbi:MAG: bifunctional riboflavin kinase/FAD synthetase [bacterium]|nr:bifunctional riboflavin kinase/FAD synthetase [bacterium]
MQHHYDLSAVNLTQSSMVTIGVFDGMHRGHQHLIRALVEQAHSADMLAVVLTFFPHPDAVLHGIIGRYYLTNPEQRARLMGELGVDHVVTLPFDQAFRQIRAAQFVDSLVARLNMRQLSVGSDFALGYKREGNVDFLKAQGEAKGFLVQAVDLVQGNGDKISSQHIREALTNGDVEQARAWLGRAYSVSGEVVHGEQRGRRIGFPTANVAVWGELVIPAAGVYAGWAWLDGERHAAVTNVGYRPTFDGQGITVEVHILDFNREIYGHDLAFTFETRLRAEQKFDGIQALIAQIARDVQAAREYLAAAP